MQAKHETDKTDASLLSTARPCCCQADKLLKACARAGERHRNATLQNIAGSLEAWTVQVKHEKGVYHTLNKLSVDVTRKVRSACTDLCLRALPQSDSCLDQASWSSCGVRLSL